MAQEIGSAFINYFYQCYDNDRVQLQNIYVWILSCVSLLAELLHADLRGTGVPRYAVYYGEDCRRFLPSFL